MHVSQLKSEMTRPLLLLSSLLLLVGADPSSTVAVQSTAPPATQPPATQPPATQPPATQPPVTVPAGPSTVSAAFVPIGVGFPQESRTAGGFGMFSKDEAQVEVEPFDTCGDHTVAYANPVFQSSSSASKGTYVDCMPHPSRTIVAISGAPAIPKFTRDMKKECEMLVCSSSSYPSGGGYPAAENKELNICGDKLPMYPDGNTATQVFANEGNCYEFDNSLKATYAAATFFQVPRWLRKDEETVNIRPFFSAGHEDPRSHRPPLVFATPTEPSTGQTWKPCDAACDSGIAVKMKMPENYQYKTLIWLNGDCPSFRICYGIEKNMNDPVKLPECYEGREIDVLVDNGVVVWPGNFTASVIEFKSKSFDKSKPVVIEFGYSKDAEFYIGNSHREVVDSSVGFNPVQAKDIVFFFPKEDCLVPQAGIFSAQVTSASAMSSQTLTQGLGNTKTIGDAKNDKYHDVQTTTTSPMDDLPASTTPVPLRADGEGASALLLDLTSNNLKSKAVYVTGKWWAWGIYIGFIIGTLLTLAIGAGLFYVLRRTVFGVWYRGMYKRYGCDASGTTGGITGIGFGTTATGTETVQGTTGGGTTAGGTTASSSVSGMSTVEGTTGGTTGGGTTGGGTTVTM